MSSESPPARFLGDSSESLSVFGIVRATFLRKTVLMYAQKIGTQT